MKTMKKSMFIALIALVATAVIGTTAVFAYWMGTKTLSRENTLTIGENTASIELGTGVADGDNPVELYENDSASFTYTVSISEVSGVKISAAVTKTDGESTGSDFRVKLFKSDGDDGWISLNNDGDDGVVDGDEIKVTVTLVASAYPGYNGAKVVVTLTDPTA